jgi:hypothetical protein
MWSTILFLALSVLTALAARNEVAAQSAGFKLCESTYALCTAALYTPVTGEEEQSRAPAT